MIPEVRMNKQNSFGRWRDNPNNEYHGKVIIEFENTNRLRNFINNNHLIVTSNGATFKITKRKKNRARKFHCEVQSLTLRELNLEKLGI